MHPEHHDNINGRKTLDYLPSGELAFVIGPHDDTDRSIRVPLCSMRLWFLHMSGQTTLSKIFEPKDKPKNTREHFLLYIVSAILFARPNSFCCSSHSNLPSFTHLFFRTLTT